MKSTTQNTQESKCKKMHGYKVVDNLKTFVFTYERKKNDVNGNPRHYITALYRIKRNYPELLASDIDIGYRSKLQAVIDTLIKLREIPNNRVYSAYIWEKEHRIRIVEI